MFNFNPETVPAAPTAQQLLDAVRTEKHPLKIAEKLFEFERSHFVSYVEGLPDQLACLALLERLRRSNARYFAYEYEGNMRNLDTNRTDYVEGASRYFKLKSTHQARRKGSLLRTVYVEERRGVQRWGEQLRANFQSGDSSCFKFAEYFLEQIREDIFRTSKYMIEWEERVARFGGSLSDIEQRILSQEISLTN